MRRLIIDGQVFHTPAWHRGMGKYSLELLLALTQLNAKKKYWQTVEIVTSSRLPLSPEVREALAAVHGVTFTPLKLQKDIIYDARNVINHNRAVVDRYVAAILQHAPEMDVDFFILSPLQGGICSTFPSDPRVHKAVVCYDLIPFLFHSIYFRNPIARIENLTKLSELVKADSFLTISQTVANDLAIHLGIDPKRIHNIDGGPINHSTAHKKIKVPRPFILMPTGNDMRKNNRTGILGFGEFNKRHDNKYSLVVTSFFEPSEVEELSGLASNIIFTGNVSGEELNFLYQNCEALLFPSEYEGLGLPVLEAVEKNKPVACSDIAVFREMSKTAFHYFDPLFGTAIAQALGETVGAAINQTEYRRVLAKYDWCQTAEAAAHAMINHQRQETITKPRVAIFGQNPECDSPLARLTQTCHAEVSRYLDADYFLEGVPPPIVPRPNMLQFAGRAVNISDANSIHVSDYDLVLYHVANSTASAKTLFTALANPGILILHDLDLGQPWQALHDQGLIHNSRYELEKQLQRAHGVAGVVLLSSLVASQKAIAVFSEDARGKIAALLDGLQLTKPVAVLTLPTASLVYEDIIPHKEDNVATFGEIGWDQTDKVTFAQFDAAPLRKIAIRRSDQPVPAGVEDIAVVASDREFENILSRIKVSYTAGPEQLADALDGLRYGVVPLSGGGQGHSTWEPPTSCVAVDSAGTATLVLRRFYNDEAIYREAAKAARQEAASQHAYRAYAQDLYRLIQPIEGGTS